MLVHKHNSSLLGQIRAFISHYLAAALPDYLHSCFLIDNLKIMISNSTSPSSVPATIASSTTWRCSTACPPTTTTTKSFQSGRGRAAQTTPRRNWSAARRFWRRGPSGPARSHTQRLEAWQESVGRLGKGRLKVHLDETRRLHYRQWNAFWRRLKLCRSTRKCYLGTE